MANFCDGIVQNIERTECIGNSLTKINSNFSELQEAGCNLQNDLTSLQDLTKTYITAGINNIRLSLTSQSVDLGPTNITSSTLFVHPYNGNVITLYDSDDSAWKFYTITTPLQFSLAALTSNTNYDIYLYGSGSNIAVEFAAWSSNAFGATPPLKDYAYGSITKVGDPTRKFVGCLRTTSAGVCEINFGQVGLRYGSDPKFFLWNQYNRINAGYNIRFIKTPGTPETLSTWTSDTSYKTVPVTGVFDGASALREIGGSASVTATGAKVSYIAGDYNDWTIRSTMLKNTALEYFTYGINVPEPAAGQIGYKKTITQLLSQSPSMGIFEDGIVNNIVSTSLEGTTQGYVNIVPLMATYTTSPGNTLYLYNGTIDTRHSFIFTGSVKY